jgi:IS5 family transposase
VVETTIHHPTDSSLPVDGVRVLSRLIRRSKPLVQGQLAGVREAFRTRMRTMRRGLQQLHRLRRRTTGEVAEQRYEVYVCLLHRRLSGGQQARRIREAVQTAPIEANGLAQRLRWSNRSLARHGAACWRGSWSQLRRSW